MAIATEESVIGEVKPLIDNAENLEAQVARAEITNDEILAQAGDLYKIINSQLKKTEEARKSLVDPLNKHVKWINTQFKPVTDKIKVIKGNLKDKMDAFVAEKTRIARELAEAERKAAEEEALKRAEELEKQGDKAAAENVVDAAASLPQTAPKGNIARGSYGSSTSSRSDWRAECVDLKEMCAAIGRGELPTDFVTVNQVKLNALATAKKEEKTKWGIRIFEKISATVR